jgi:hypothetical protein
LIIITLTDNRFDVSGGINPVVISVDADEDEEFGAWSHIFGFLL